MKCRKEYFRSVMRQELAWFDTQNQAEIAIKFNLDSMAYQLALGEKISNLIMIVAMFIAGLAVSSYVGWILALILLAYLPFLIMLQTKNITTKVEVN